jgi:hypothetical protein
MYLGFDEGSMGCLEASLAGVPLITTPQGFHLDLPGGITHEIRNFDDLLRLFTKLTFKVSQKDLHSQFMWNRYAKDALKIWQGDSSFETNLDSTSPRSTKGGLDENHLLVQMTFRRYVSAIGRIPSVQFIRNFIRRGRKL